MKVNLYAPREPFVWNLWLAEDAKNGDETGSFILSGGMAKDEKVSLIAVSSNQA
jgi:hypothetical protein